MAQLPKNYIQDLTQDVQIRYCGTLLFNSDSDSNIINVALYNGKDEAPQTGSVVCCVICCDGSTVPVTGGTISGNVVSVTLGGSGLIPGQARIGIKIVTGGIKTTIFKAIYNVELFETDNVVDPSSRITLRVGDLVQDINDAVASIPADYSDLTSAIKPFAGIVEFESGAFNNDRITKGDNVKRIRNVSPIPIRDFFSITLPTGYSMYIFWFTKSMELITPSTGQTSINYRSLKSGSLVNAYYVNVQISKDDALNSDISGYVSTLNSDTVVVQRSDTDDTLTKKYSPADSKTVGDLLNNSIKMQLGANPDRKACDHGGFWTRPSEAYMEDSPLAFLRSAKEGIKYHNVDVVCSSDGVPFVSHNDTVTDTGGVSHVISQNTAASIKTWIIGTSDYSFELMTLSEMNEYVKKLGGILDTVDVSYMTDTQAAALKTYYNSNNINPTWTNFDSPTQRTAFKNSSGGDFGIYISCENITAIENAITYISNNPGVHYALNIYASTSGVGPDAVEPYIGQIRNLGAKIYVNIYNNLTSNTIPGWADGVMSETINVNYEEWKANIT